jgi:o-succinylbenzoate synthase
MRITDIKTGTFSIPLKTPFKTALRTALSLTNVMVRVETGQGLAGYGEAAPTAVITGDTIPSILGAVEGFIKPALIGRDLSEFDSVMEALSSCVAKNTSAKAAVDMALYDIRAQSLGVPLCKLLGGARAEVETDITISLNSAEEMVSDSLKAVESGFRILKVKVGKGGAADASTVLAIRNAVGPKPVIRVDANQGWSPKESVRVIRALEDAGAGIELVEQPVPAHGLDGMRFVAQNVLTPILADECVFSPADAIEAIRSKAADLINIKLMKAGGIHQALKICAVAESYGVGCMMGCMLESRASVSAAAHLAAAKGVITMADLDGPSLCAEDPFTGGPVFDGRVIRMTQEPGIGTRCELQVFD